MRPVASRSPALLFLCTVAAFAAGPALGVAVAHWTAPGSELAQLVSPIAFALAFVGGLMFWFGIGVAAVVGGAVHRLLRGRWSWRRRAPSAAESIPPGYGAFVPLAVGMGLLAGMVTGLAPRSTSFWLSCAAHLGAGAVYGAMLRALARDGYLPFPEPE